MEFKVPTILDRSQRHL